MNGYWQNYPDKAGHRGARASYMVAAGQRGQLLMPEELLLLLQQVADSQDKQAFASLFRFYAPRLKSFLLKQGF